MLGAGQAEAAETKAVLIVSQAVVISGANVVVVSEVVRPSKHQKLLSFFSLDSAEGL